ncbi:hypothetical protein [Salinivibrio sp. ML290]|uniref:hypothetical protein n=1 Tax=Salinivibrio sp. ML290 TaxID=1909468 RepID=UPI00098858CB|nr:hypothetical protein [Salinivibrio sp. ML290]OOE71335.1 hypothetical protein BZG23_16190 [Salinivibrio sp. ML290]
MKFKIVDKRIKNLYVGPLSVFMFWPSLIFFGSWFMGDVISFEYLLYVFLFCSIPALINYKGRCDFKNYAENHAIEISDKGLISYEPDTQEIMEWESVKTVKVKRSKHKVKSIKIIGNHGLTADLSRYGDLDRLYDELKKVIAADRWR